MYFPPPSAGIPTAELPCRWNNGTRTDHVAAASARTHTKRAPTTHTHTHTPWATDAEFFLLYRLLRFRKCLSPFSAIISRYRQQPRDEIMTIPIPVARYKAQYKKLKTRSRGGTAISQWLPARWRIDEPRVYNILYGRKYVLGLNYLFDPSPSMQFTFIPLEIGHNSYSIC